MADQHASGRRQFFQRFRLRLTGPDALHDPERHAAADTLPADPAAVRHMVVDWRADVAPSWEGETLVVFTQAGAMFRWELSPAEVALLQRIDGQLPVGTLQDAVGATDAGTAPASDELIALLTGLLDAGVLRVVTEAAT